MVSVKKGLSKKEYEARREEAIKKLKAWFEPILQSGKKPVIKATIRNVSRSGMQRTADFYLIQGEDLIRINGSMALINDTRVNDDYELILKGCGMDMLFNEVYLLSCNLYGHKNDHEYNITRWEGGKEVKDCGSYLLHYEAF